MHFGEHREALPLGVDTQRDHAALAHTVDVPGRTLDIVRIQILPGQHDEILRAAAHVDPPLLVEVTQVAGVEPAVLAGEWNDAVRREITAGDRRTAKFDGADLSGPLRRSVPGDAHVHARDRESQAHDVLHVLRVIRNRLRAVGFRDGLPGDRVDDRRVVVRAEGHRQGRLGEPIARRRRAWPQAETRTDGGEVRHIAVIDGFGPVASRSAAMTGRYRPGRRVAGRGPAPSTRSWGPR